ncbi:autophagocytosis associated protein [Scheffersomyces amazonensis]|uniref:autophagocytosis associated protein n=1 Tax=Scheffersomyces amazonensis TaxID=1078765 RepID=UPI00315D9229
MSSLRSRLSSLRDYITPINNTSNFSSTGEISPSEFVLACDYLISRFPTWYWGPCPENLKKGFLPSDKQFLMTKHVPSHVRANEYLSNGSEDINLDFEEEEEINDEDDDSNDGWTKTRSVIKKKTNDTKEEDVANSATGPLTKSNSIDDIDDFLENDDEDNADFDNIEDDDFDDLEYISDSKQTLRRYDIYITYSTSYRVPKLYLVGYNSNGIPLTPKQMMEDISGDYKDKTATIENLPVAYNTTSVMIHPCRHASVMKVFMKHSKSNKEKKEAELADKLKQLDLDSDPSSNTDEEETGIRVDQYLITFLKFMSSVIPGIEYDFTGDAL